MAQVYWSANHWSVDYWSDDYWSAVDLNFTAVMSAVQEPNTTTGIEYWGENYWSEDHWSKNYWANNALNGTFTASTLKIGTLAQQQQDNTNALVGSAATTVIPDWAIEVSFSWRITDYPAVDVILVSTQEDNGGISLGSFIALDTIDGFLAVTQEDNSQEILGTSIPPTAIDINLVGIQEDDVSAIVGVVTDIVITMAVTQDDQLAAIAATLILPNRDGVLADAIQDDNAALMLGDIYDAGVSVIVFSSSQESNYSVGGFTGQVLYLDTEEELQGVFETPALEGAFEYEFILQGVA